MSLASSIIGSNATSKAVQSLVSGANQSIDASTKGADYAIGAAQGAQQSAEAGNGLYGSGISNASQTIQQQLAPYLDIGNTAANNLSAAVAPGGQLTQQFGYDPFQSQQPYSHDDFSYGSFQDQPAFSYDPSQVKNDPSYQFQLNEGLDAVKRAAAATGTLSSSATLKGLTNYAGGVASTAIGQDYQRALSTYNTNRANSLSAYTTNRANSADIYNTNRANQADIYNTNQANSLSAYNTNRANAADIFNTNRTNNLSNLTIPLQLGQSALQSSNQNFSDTANSMANIDVNTGQYVGNQYQKQGNNIADLLGKIGQAKSAGSMQQSNIWGGLANSFGLGLTPGASSSINGVLGKIGLGIG